MLIVGGGKQATQKLHTLEDTGAHVTVVAPALRPGFPRELPGARLAVVQRAYRRADLKGMHLVIAATDDSELNRRIFGQAQTAGITANAVDDPDCCDYYTPSVLRRGAVTLAFSTSGRFPGVSRALRETLQAWLPAQDGGLLRELFSLRTALRRSSHGAAVRRRALRGLIERFKKDYLEPGADPMPPRVGAWSGAGGAGTAARQYNEAVNERSSNT